jgi:hypothetical protein
MVEKLADCAYLVSVYLCYMRQAQNIITEPCGEHAP